MPVVSINVMLITVKRHFHFWQRRSIKVIVLESV